MLALSRKKYLFLLPVFLYLLAFVIFPTVYTWWMSFTNYGMGSRQFIGITNYSSLISDSVFQRSLFNSLYLVGVAVPVELLLGFFIALLINRPFRGKAVVFWFILLPMIVAPVVVGLSFRVLYDPSLGFINYLLRIVGITGPEWLTTSRLAMPAIILIDIWEWTPFMVLLLVAGLQYIPRSILEAAQVDGASYIASFYYIKLPLMKNFIVLAVMFRAMDCFNKAFDQIMMTTRGGPGYATETLPIYIYKTAFMFIKFGRAAAASLMFFFVIMIFITLVRRVSREQLLQV